MNHSVNHQNCQPDIYPAHLTETGADAVVAASLAGDVVPVLQTLPGDGTAQALRRASLRAGMSLRWAGPNILDPSCIGLPMLAAGRDGIHRPATLAGAMRSLAVGEEHILLINELDRVNGAFAEHVRQTLQEKGTRGLVVLIHSLEPVMSILRERTLLVEAEQMHTVDQILAGSGPSAPSA